MPLKYDAQTFSDDSVSTAKPNDNYQTTLNAYTKEAEGGLNYTGIVGINVGKIPDMKQGIDTYITYVDKAIDTEIGQIQYSDAFSSEEMVNEIKKFSEAVKTATVNYFSHLRAFQNLLTGIENSYNNQNSEMQSNLQSESTSTSSVVEEYASSAK